MTDHCLRLTVLGSTGSIGTNTLDVVARHPERFEVFALSASRQVDLMVEQCRQFRPRIAVMADEGAAAQLRDRLAEAGIDTAVEAGPQALCDVAAAPEVDAVMAAIVGAAGLAPSLAAARAGKRLLLANKEALVVGGDLFMDTVRQGGGLLLPIDSEHSAIFQSLPDDPASWDRRVDKIILTASGGPFRQRDPGTLADVTPEQACAHPNWVMGRKISVDSATMMNKGLEVIEAHWLFGAPREAIEVVVHPQSVIHSMVEYHDGSVIAQLGAPDMRTPIACALAWPERIDAGVAPVDFAALGRLEFGRVDEARFPCVRLAYSALDRGGTAPAILNAANEVAVASFLEGRLAFTGIPAVIENVLAGTAVEPLDTLDAAWKADREARESARREVSRLGRAG